jgi:sec-independent protein translocase protein TatC
MATSNMNPPTMENRSRDEDELSTMSLVDHLEELRWRIFKSLIAVAVGAIVAFIFRDQIMDFLKGPLPTLTAGPGSVKGPNQDKPLYVLGLTQGLTIELILSAVTGCVVALPVLLYQTWAFIAPGLYKYEKKNAVPFILIGVVLFIAGVSLGYIVLRFPVQWLIQFQASSFTQLITADSYFEFVAIFMLVFGLIFELPLVLTFLARIGIVSEDLLRKKRAIAHIGMWAAATFLTPGADIYSPIILGTAMSCLYELTIIFIKIFVKPDPAIADVDVE